jgi:hypothetical protein
LVNYDRSLRHDSPSLQVHLARPAIWPRLH